MASLKIMKLPPGTMRRQRGKGLLGSALGTLSRVIRPILSHGSRILKPALQRTAKKLGAQAIRAGTDVLTDVALDNKNLKSSLKQRALENLPTLKRVLKEEAIDSGKKMVEKLHKSQSGKGKPPFKGRSRKSTTRKQNSPTAIFDFPIKRKKPKKSIID